MSTKHASETTTTTPVKPASPATSLHLKDAAELKKAMKKSKASPTSISAFPLEVSDGQNDPQLGNLGVDGGSDRILNPFGGKKAIETGVVIEITGSLGHAIREYARKNGEIHSLSAAKASANSDSDDDDDELTPKGDCKGSDPQVSMSLGCGQTTVDWEGHTVQVTLQAFGEPHACHGYYQTVTLSTPAAGAEEVAEVQASLKRLCQAALTAYETAPKGSITVHSYNARFGYWRKDRVIRKRALGSIILPEKTTSAIFDDARLFLDEKARAWYTKHSIPYKRTFLLYGPPGCGKSTLISACASEFDMNVCMLSLADPELKDDSLRQAVQCVPKRSVICLEDCDAMFNHHRQKEENVGSVTFSGLLNALDGVGDPHGTIFFLTTNHRDRLDKALIRPGRCDVQVCIEHANDDQIMRTLVRFYEEATPEQQKVFLAKVRAADGGRRVSMAALQEHFVQHRLSTLEQAISEMKLGAMAEDSAPGQMWS